MNIPYSFNLMAVGENITAAPVEGICGVFVYNSDNDVVLSAMTVNDITLDYFNRRNMSVWSGGNAGAIGVFSGCAINVYSGGICSAVELNARGSAQIYTKGRISSVQIKSNATLYVSSGGAVHDPVVSEGGQITMQSSAVLSGGIFMSGADGLTVSSGSVMASAEFYNTGEKITVSSGGICRNITMCANMTISSGGAASRVALTGAGALTVSRGGQVYNLSADSGCIVSCGIYGEDSATVITGSGIHGEFFVSSGSGANLDIYGYKNILKVYVGGRVSGARVYSGASCYVSAGGSGVDIEIYSSGAMYLESAGIASDIKIYSGAVFNMLQYASCNDIIADGGVIYNDPESTTSGVQIINGGSQTVNPGGIANDVQIVNGKLNFSSGIGSGLVIHSGGSCSAYRPLWLDDIVVKSGGTLIVNSGHATRVSSETGANCIASNGGVIDYIQVDP